MWFKINSNNNYKFSCSNNNRKYNNYNRLIRIIKNNFKILKLIMIPKIFKTPKVIYLKHQDKIHKLSNKIQN